MNATTAAAIQAARTTITTARTRSAAVRALRHLYRTAELSEPAAANMIAALENALACDNPAAFDDYLHFAATAR